MKPREFKLSQDAILGLAFVAIGLTFLFIGAQYPWGSSGRMGPGYFPVIISILLTAVGLILLVRSRYVASEAMQSLPWIPILVVPGAIALFGFLLEKIGLSLAVLMLTLACAATSAKFRFSWSALAGAAAFSLACAVIFVELLGLPIPILGSWLETLGF